MTKRAISLDATPASGRAAFSLWTDNAARLTPFDLRCIDNALQYVERHYREKISADCLAIEVGLSKEKLQAGFRVKTGSTLHEYILLVRIEKAKELLINTNDPVKAVADAAGFANDSHFCKTFRKITNISPVGYRLLNIA